MSQPGGRAPQRAQTLPLGSAKAQEYKNQELCPYGCYRCHRRGGSRGVLPAHAAVAVQHKMSLLCHFCPSCSTPRRETRSLSRTNPRAGARQRLGLAAEPAFKRGITQLHCLLSLLIPAQDAVGWMPMFAQCPRRGVRDCTSLQHRPHAPRAASQLLLSLGSLEGKKEVPTRVGSWLQLREEKTGLLHKLLQSLQSPVAAL